MEVARELVKLVGRSFYEDKYSVFLDFLLRERMLPDDILADRMQVLIKDVNRMAAKLREDGLIKVQVRQELRHYDDRPINRTYYFVDLCHFVDVTKYRLHRMRRILEDRLRSQVNDKSYYCAHCKRNYSILDVSKLVNPVTFLFECEVCKSELQSVDASMLGVGSQLHSSQLIEQTNEMLRLLRRLEDVTIPAFDPVEHLKHSEAFELLAPDDDDAESIISDISSFVASPSTERLPELKVAGAINPKPLEVEFLPSTSKSAAAQSNEMPLWHTHSTVTGVQVKPTDASTGKTKVDIKTASPEKQLDYVSYYNETIKERDDLESADKRTRTEASSTPTTAAGTGMMVAVSGELKDITAITDEDKNRMTEEEYQKYYEAFMSLEQE